MRRAELSGMEVVVVLIVVIISFLLMLGATEVIVGYFMSKSDIEACKYSISVHAFVKDVAKQFKSIKCPRREVVFYDDEVRINGRAAELDSFNQLTNDIVNKVVAEELKTCWYMTGEGKLDIFKGDAITQKNVCLVCSEIGFDESVSNGYFYGLGEYLRNREVTVKKKEGKVTMKYYDYLMQGADPVGGKIGLAVESIQSDKGYFIFFVARKTGEIPEAIPIVGTASGYYVVVGDIDSLTSHCNFIYN